MEALTQILYFPDDGPGDVHDKLDVAQMWAVVSGEQFYDSAEANANIIQNPYFCYIQKALALTIFGR